MTDQNEIPVCVLDAETRSAQELGRGGTNAMVYAQHPTTDVWLLRYAFDDHPDTIYRWFFQEPMPDNLRAHVEAGGTVSAHNAGFEYAIWNFILAPRYGWNPLPIEQMDDTAARAARCGLPRNLEKGAQAMGLEQQKDMKGSAQMKRMAKPRKVMEVEDETPAGMSLLNDPKYKDPVRYTYHDGKLYEWWAVDDRISNLGEYCDQDVRTQMDMHLALPLLPQMEWDIWQATMRANIRGVQLDREFILRAITIVNRQLAQYAQELLVLTAGQVKSHTDLNGMKAWLAGQGFEVDSLDKNVVAEMVADKTLPDNVKRVVSIRSEAGKSSVAKFPAMREHMDKNGVAPDQLVYYGAISTGRWSGQGIQLQNLPARGGVEYASAEWHIDNVLGSDLDEAADFMDMMENGSVIETLSMCLRGAIKARSEMDIVCADYSNIEGRKAAWLGGEEWKLDAFRAYDAGTGPDLYKVAAGGILGQHPDDVSKALRNALGKVSELALQFQGGVGAFLSMAAVYRVEIADYWDAIQAALDPRIIEEAYDAWDAFGATSGTDKKTWIAAESVKRAWREKHPGIVQAWRDCEDGAVGALRSPGTPFYACDGKVAFIAKSMFGKPFLLMRLPSGRCIHYANAALRDKKTPWGAVKSQVMFDKVEQGRIVRSATYGGDLFQSCLKRGTLVLVPQGWKPIEEVSSRDWVWDGRSWALCGGAVCNGSRRVIDLAGVKMTPDHKVLTNDGWKEASSCEGHNRAESRVPDSFAVRGVRWEEIPVVGEMYVRDRTDVPRQRPSESFSKRIRNVLRVPAQADDQRTPSSARDVTPSAVRRVGFYERAVLPETQRQLRELWRTGYSCLQTVARVVHRFSGRYGAFVYVRADTRTPQRERWLLPRQLCVAPVAVPAREQAEHPTTFGENSAGAVTGDRHPPEHAVLPTQTRVPVRPLTGSPLPGEQFSEVYDILNCGPRSRFTVRDGDGLPMIVHNCTQGSARDIMGHGWLTVEGMGYVPLFSVHDELASEYPEGQADLSAYETGLSALPAWAEGLPVTAEGYISKRFRKD